MKAFLSIKPAWGKGESGTGGTIRRTFMAEVTDRMRDIWILDAEMETVTGAMETVGLEPTLMEKAADMEINPGRTSKGLGTLLII